MTHKILDATGGSPETDRRTIGRFGVASVELLDAPKRAGDPYVYAQPHVTADQLHDIFRCAAQYRFRHISRMAELPREEIIQDAAIRVAAEAYIATNYETEHFGVAERKRAALSAATCAADVHLSRMELPIGERFRTGIHRAIVAFAEESWAAISPEEISGSYVIHWQDPSMLPLVTSATCLNGQGDELTVLDFQIAQRHFPSTTEIDANMRFTAYCLARELASGVETRNVESHVFLLDQREGQPSMKVVESTRGEGAFRRLFLSAKYAQKMIEGGIFPPSGSARDCKTCFFITACDLSYGRLTA